MKIINVAQGSPEWHVIRASSCNASEAAAMLGLSPKLKRNELLHLKKTAGEQEFSNWVQINLLDKGHEIEALTRPIAKALVGEDLFPITGTEEVEGMLLLASFDGLTMEGDTSWENKMWNAELVAAVEANEVPDSHWPQLEHQLLVSGADRTLFTVSDGTEDNTNFLYYTSIPERRKTVIAGWAQFLKDLDAYQPAEYIPAPKATPIKALPALLVELTGEVRSSNLVSYKQTALQMIASINTNLVTDQDFADAENMVKFCAAAEAELETVKKIALSKTESIDELFRTIDLLREQMRIKRLELNKLVTSRKDAIRIEIQQGGKKALAEHIAALNVSLGKPYMPQVQADFAGAVKNKRSIASLNDAVDTELSRAKIAANETAERIRANMKAVAELGADYPTLFYDMGVIVLKASDDLTTLVKLRIQEAKDAEAKRAAEAARIAAEQAAARQAEEARRAAAAAAAVPQTLAEAVATGPAASAVLAGSPVSIPPVAPVSIFTVAPAPAPVAANDDGRADVLASIDRALPDLSTPELQQVFTYIQNTRLARRLTA